MSLGQRDAFLADLLELAKKDKDVILISPDMGAPTIDRWKVEVPKQFFSVGIAEQNAINLAAGMSSRGKKVYVYLMACWCCRCLEQIRYSCAMGANPITLLGTGVGLGYAPAGAAHAPTDDMTYMRAIGNIEIFSPATTSVAKQLVDYTYRHRKLVHVRLERSYDAALDPFYSTFNLKDLSGVFSLKPAATSACVMTSGYLLSRALELSRRLDLAVYDVYRLKPVPDDLHNVLKAHDLVITLEEQAMKGGGFASMIAEEIVDSHLPCEMLKFGLDEPYIIENGTRNELLDAHGLAVETMLSAISAELAQTY